jgi:hypothetical protein
MLKSPPPAMAAAIDENRARHQRSCVGPASISGKSGSSSVTGFGRGHTNLSQWADSRRICGSTRPTAFQFDPKRIREVLAKIKADGILVDTTHRPVVDLPDQDDEPFLAVALAGAVDFLVTGNLPDYPPAKCQACAVVSPAAFMAIWNKHGNR